MFLVQSSRRSCCPASSILACIGPSDLWYLGQGIWQFQHPSVLHYSSQSYSQKFFWTTSVKQDSIFVSAFEKFSKSLSLPVSCILLLLNTYVFNMEPMYALTNIRSIYWPSVQGGLGRTEGITKHHRIWSEDIGFCFLLHVGQTWPSHHNFSTVHIYKAEMQTSVHRNTTNCYSSGCSFKTGYFLLNRQCKIWLSVNVILSSEHPVSIKGLIQKHP